MIYPPSKIGDNMEIVEKAKKRLIFTEKELESLNTVINLLDELDDKADETNIFEDFIDYILADVETFTDMRIFLEALRDF